MRSYSDQRQKKILTKNVDNMKKIEKEAIELGNRKANSLLPKGLRAGAVNLSLGIYVE